MYIDMSMCLLSAGLKVPKDMQSNKEDALASVWSPANLLIYHLLLNLESG